jgi:hypothetical protein
MLIPVAIENYECFGSDRGRTRPQNHQLLAHQLRLPFTALEPHKIDQAGTIPSSAEHLFCPVIQMSRTCGVSGLSLAP